MPGLPQQVSAEQPLRSAKDFESEEALRQALTNMNSPSYGSSLFSVTAPDQDDQQENIGSNNSMNIPSNSADDNIGSNEGFSGKGHDCNSNNNSESGSDDIENPSKLNDNWDWVINNLDPETTEPQSINQELRRLKVLMSYMVLDSEREESFDRLTKMAARVFNVEIALVSLVDLGRQWFMSNHGFGDIRQTSRKNAFCAHAIQEKDEVFVVPDALKDPRFRDSPFVLGPPGIRFYAGAPLISSEGYKLGTFCIIGSTPREEGLSAIQRKSLQDFASIAIKTMADRRHLADQEDPSRLVACTAHDLLTPLSGVLLSLSTLKEDEEFDKSLNEHQKECIATASRSSEMMRRICQTTIETLRKANKGVVVSSNTSSPGNSGPKSRGGKNVTGSDARPFIDIREFVKSLHMIIDPIPKRVPLVITVDSSVPMHIMSDDLKIFRSSLNLLSNACRNTETGSIRFRMYVKDDQLVFECEDSGQDIEVDDRARLFHPDMDDFGTVADLGLYSLAAQVDSLGGGYGFRPRGEDVDGAAIMDTKGRKVTGSVFWFSIPVVVPSDMPRPSSRDGITHLSGIRSVESFASAGASMSSIDTAAAAISRNNSGLLAVTAAAARSMSGSSNNCLDCLVRTLSAQSSAAFGKNKQPLRGTVNSTWDSKKSSKPININIMRIRQALGEKDAARPTAAFTAAANAAVKLSSSTLLGLPTGVSSVGPPTPALSSAVDAERKKRALVIEDSVVVRKTLARALQKLGYEVSQAVDGMEGLRELKKTVFDLSLCDFLMPNMDGLDCVQQYRKWEEENRPSFRQYIVGISAHAAHNDVTKGLEIGMNDFKPKPVTIKTLNELHESTELVQVRATLDELHRVSKNSSSDMSLKGKKQKMDADAILHSAADLSAASLILQRKRRSRSELSINWRPDDERLKKRAKQLLSSEDLESAGKAVEKVCLIASDSHNHGSDLAMQMAANGWKVTQVQDGNSVLRMLKTRNWGAVLLDDELPLLSGSRCVAAFREWELKNRVCRQNNVFLVCSSGLPSPHDATSVVQAPCGFDGALDAPVMWTDVKYLLKKSQVGEPQHRGGLNIVTR